MGPTTASMVYLQHSPDILKETSATTELKSKRGKRSSPRANTNAQRRPCQAEKTCSVGCGGYRLTGLMAAALGCARRACEWLVYLRPSSFKRMRWRSTGVHVCSRRFLYLT